MQITIPRRELKEAVGGFSKIVNGKTTLPILGGVRFENNGRGIVAQATDLDQTARYTFAGAEAQGDGAFILPLASLKELAKGKENEAIEFETGDSGTVFVTNHVGAHAVKHPVQGLDPEEWPSSPADTATKPAEGFLETYRRLLPFASTDQTRYVLNGVYVDVADQGEHPVTMVATDGRRLSLWNSMNLPLARSVIVPAAKILAWNGLTGGTRIGLRTEREKKDVRVLAVAIGVGPWYLDLKAIDGPYPNFRQVVPADPDAPNRITFTDADVQALQKILPTFPGANTHSQMITLRAGSEGRLVIAGRGTDDKTDTTLELTGGSTFTGKMPGVGVNAFYLLDALDAGFRTFTTPDELSPLKSEDGRGGVHVLMPMRLSTETAKPPEAKSEPEAEQVPQAPGTEPAATGATESTPPAAEPEADNTKEKKQMPNDEKTGTRQEPTALDKVLVAVDTAKGKLREAASALAEVADSVKTAVKEGKAQAADLEKARATLQKLQAISL